MKHKYLKNVVTLSYDRDKCIGCGMCVKVCPHGVFDFVEKKAEIEDIDSCMECGACAMKCPAEAIGVNAGTGCAVAIITSWFTGKEPTCGCEDSSCAGSQPGSSGSGSCC